MKNKLVVKQDPENELPFEVMAKSIAQIGESLAKIQKTRVTRKLIVALIADDTKQPKNRINLILDSYEQLESIYLTKGKP